MRAAVVAHRHSRTNLALAAGAWNGTPAALLPPRRALLVLAPGDVALARLDVRDDLEGVEDGLTALDRLHENGVRVLNRPPALLCAHDKLLTARCLRRAGLPHPRSVFVQHLAGPPDVDFPAVVKPRFGSRGRDVLLCRDRHELERRLEALRSRSWFRNSGALVQELIPPLGHDLRLVIAGGTVVGAARRTAAAGEWRTNVALGASVAPVSPPPVAVELAVAAASAAGLDLVGVDLLPTGPGGFCVLELNGAVDFTPRYSLSGQRVYADAMQALAGNPERAVRETLAAQA